MEENIGQKDHNTGFDNDFLDMIPKAYVTKGGKKDKLDFLNIFKFCASKDSIN